MIILRSIIVFICCLSGAAAYSDISSTEKVIAGRALAPLPGYAHKIVDHVITVPIAFDNDRLPFADGAGSGALLRIPADLILGGIPTAHGRFIGILLVDNYPSHRLASMRVSGIPGHLAPLFSDLSLERDFQSSFQLWSVRDPRRINIDRTEFFVSYPSADAAFAFFKCNEIDKKYVEYCEHYFDFKGLEVKASYPRELIEYHVHIQGWIQKYLAESARVQ